MNHSPSSHVEFHSSIEVQPAYDGNHNIVWVHRIENTARFELSHYDSGVISSNSECDSRSYYRMIYAGQASIVGTFSNIVLNTHRDELAMGIGQRFT